MCAKTLLANVFSQYTGCLFTFLIVSFDDKFVIFMNPIYLVFLLACAFGVIYKNTFQIQDHEDVFLCFFPNIFLV